MDMKKRKTEINKLFCGGDVMLGDGHYTGIVNKYKDIKVICPFRNSKKKPLTEQQVKFNKYQRKIRNKIEITFGKLSTRFNCLQNKYRGTNESHERFLRIAVSIHNELIRKSNK